MTIRLMKALDHALGLPLCTALAVVATVEKRLRRAPLPGSGWAPRRVVVQKFFGLGSLALMMPLLRALRERYPECEIELVTFESNVPLLRRFEITKTTGISPDRPARFVAQTLCCLLRRIMRPADVVVDLEFLSKYSTMMAFFASRKRRIGFDLASFWRRGILTDIIYFNCARHIQDIYGMVASSLDAQAFYRPDESPAASPRREAHERVRAMFEEWSGGDGEARWLAVNVHAGEMVLARRWSLEKFARVVERAVRELGAYIVFTGSAQERPRSERCIAMLAPDVRTQAFNAAGATTLDELLELLRCVRVLLTNDSGPLHLAAVIGTPTVSIWGPVNPGLYAPRGPEHHTVYLHYPCSPCMYIYRTEAGRYCNFEHPCMETLGEDIVFEALQRAWQGADA
ncbi:MAG: glycosyltransferase family 9 protein [Acidobacteriota bacterium]|nr:MAG: glycosyltransferase family 9 protein [Acidobacteriota bacterium]